MDTQSEDLGYRNMDSWTHGHMDTKPRVDKRKPSTGFLVKKLSQRKNNASPIPPKDVPAPADRSPSRFNRICSSIRFQHTTNNMYTHCKSSINNSDIPSLHNSGFKPLTPHRNRHIWIFASNRFNYCPPIRILGVHTFNSGMTTFHSDTSQKIHHSWW